MGQPLSKIASGRGGTKGLCTQKMGRLTQSWAYTAGSPGPCPSKGITGAFAVDRRMVDSRIFSVSNRVATNLHV